MFRYAWEWMDVKGMATDVSSRLRPEALTVDRYWRGPAFDGYAGTIVPQANAAARIGAIADKTGMSLGACGAAAAAFYLALGVIVVKFIAAAIAAIAAFGSAVFSWAGAAIIVEEAAVNTAAITTAVGLLMAVLTAQATVMVVLHGEAADGTSLPGAHWPGARSDRFSDATVTDGDADWSVRR
jgi:hypothetical protein